MDTHTKDTRTDILKRIYDEFIIKKQEILNIINNLKTNEELINLQQSITHSLNSLQAFLAPNWDQLSKYDQKSMQNQIEELYHSLESKKSILQPKKKFQFKNRTQLKTPTELINQNETNSSHKLTDINDFKQSDTIIIKDQKLSTLKLDEFKNANDMDRSVELLDIHQCVLDLSNSNTSIGTIHIKNISHSILILPPIANSLLIYNMNHCILIVGCHQFRIHDSQQNQIYLHCSSDPIIEDCTSLNFLPYPKPELNDKIKSTKYFNSLNNNNHWDQVKDFNWIKSTPSPNFHLSQYNDSIKDLIQEVDSLSLQSYLEKYLPQNI